MFDAFAIYNKTVFMIEDYLLLFYFLVATSTINNHILI